MSDNDTVAKLKRSRFFSNMQAEDLEEVAKICREVELPQRTVIFEEYDRAKEVYIILSGQVSLAICEPKQSCRQIAIVGDGDLVGWSSLLGRTRLSDTASTLTPVKALVFDGSELSKFCNDHPSFGFEFMRQAASAMALRLSGTRLQLLEMCGSRLPLSGIQLESD
ncbi:Crp/Fnr family transcriptional regulator [Bythopirellula polymerisocia]|uniref:cAMP receptor protein n=1 Tax=Bythopirellula polymerisocia TaxID=2528003 RepID=A0A5C6D4H3_9BACT|nr:Crp/Fnr family transcriptional regulator [Bythopirellula polymerisocia]TWU29749.1 cAMP receptor protein [Bythopirellula polymerisocia]